MGLLALLIKIKLKKLTKMMTTPPAANQSAAWVSPPKNEGVKQIWRIPKTRIKKVQTLYRIINC